MIPERAFAGKTVVNNVPELENTTVCTSVNPEFNSISSVRECSERLLASIGVYVPENEVVQPNV